MGPHGPTSNIKCMKMMGRMRYKKIHFWVGHSGSSPLGTLHDAVFGPIILRAGYPEDLAFVDNNCSLAWVTRGAAGPCRDDVSGILEGLWLQMALRKAFKWWERV